MAENFFKVRNTYLGIDGKDDDPESQEFHKFSKGDTSNLSNALDHSEHMMNSLQKSSGNEYFRHTPNEMEVTFIRNYPKIKLFL